MSLERELREYLRMSSNHDPRLGNYLMAMLERVRGCETAISELVVQHQAICSILGAFSQGMDEVMKEPQRRLKEVKETHLVQSEDADKPSG